MTASSKEIARWSPATGRPRPAIARTHDLNPWRLPPEDPGPYPHYGFINYLLRNEHCISHLSLLYRFPCQFPAGAMAGKIFSLPTLSPNRRKPLAKSSFSAIRGCRDDFFPDFPAWQGNLRHAKRKG